MMVYICTKFHENILVGIKVIADTIFTGKVLKGHSSLKNVGGVRIILICMSTDDGFYLYQVS